MADVACFCGCLFSFDGGAGACPKCGKPASVTGLWCPEAPDAADWELPTHRDPVDAYLSGGAGDVACRADGHAAVGGA